MPRSRRNLIAFALAVTCLALWAGCGFAERPAAQNPGTKPAGKKPAGKKPAGEEPADKPQAGADKKPGPSESAGKKPVDGAEKKPAEGEGRNTNRLAKETSPYLLMHAHNPVDWYPWGPEALEKAKREKKLIFLSIGYSSCHWCHVMERESFLDKEIAKLMNDNFVCIKVDREERPDIDNIYMTSLHVYYQLIGTPSSGGWPLSMFLTPAGEPFFGGTYFPARDGDRGPSTGFLTILKRVQDVWKEQPDRLKKDAKTLAGFVKRQLESERTVGQKPIGPEMVGQLESELKEQYDPEYGGFGYSAENPRRPKFPEPSNLFFLIEQVSRSKDLTSPNAKMLIGTLDRLAMGGIRDHLGGGFHRYSVDRFWRIPHFEKMLYDNGQLASVYAETYALTKQVRYRRITDQLLAFVLRELRSPEGGFYSALDAESEGVEGKFYRWEKAEVEKALTKGEFALFAVAYGLDSSPNFEEFYAPQFDKPPAEIAKALDSDVESLEQQLAPVRRKLLAIRDKRKRPLTDTKILTSWNGLMIRGFADAGRILEEPEYVAAAEKAAEFVLANLSKDDGRLLRTYGRGEAKLNAYLPDYAFMIDGMLALHRATGDKRWLDRAATLQEKQIELFWDDKNSGFFFTSDDHESLLARSKRFHDGAQPSGNSVAAQNLVALSKALSKPEYLKMADATIQAAGPLLNRAPTAAPRMVQALQAVKEAEKAK